METTILRLTGLTPSELHSSKKPRAIRARLCLYHHCHQSGMLHHQIATRFRKSRSTVTYHLAGFRYLYRHDPIFRTLYDRFQAAMQSQSGRDGQGEANALPSSGERSNAPTSPPCEGGQGDVPPARRKHPPGEATPTPLLDPKDLTRP